ncbi:hypothetical protein BS78_03G291300 [Paspalum vaginatum]|nr:hypothetical protein BS78_03G291300 [Paspalum vaginatum]
MGPGIDDDLEANLLEASGGRRRRGCCSAIERSEALFVTCFLTVPSMIVFAIFAIVALTYREPSFSVHLTGYEGIDPGGAARVVSPSFDVTLRVNDTCVDIARVAVVHSGVALGWATVEPRDCVMGRWARDIEVVARGRGVGLSQRLRDRMSSEWRSSGSVELDVAVMMYKYRHKNIRFDDDKILQTFDGKVKMEKITMT